ncbi:serpentine type 7TM GPCR chemoreceptor srt domain-containing protein [Ditylenchus destructor]|nr:serpentine type 7TM GPCR chemoreceptor srt domain-containing protein [Ditylenchus destructor]
MYTLLIYVPSLSTPRMAAISQLVWISVHGMPGVVYLTMNSSMRKNVKKMLGIGENKVPGAATHTFEKAKQGQAKTLQPATPSTGAVCISA